MSKTTTLSKPKLVKSEAALAFAEAGSEVVTKNEKASNRVFFAPEGHRRLTINLREDLHKKLRLMAVEQDTTITDILTRLVNKELGKQP